METLTSMLPPLDDASRDRLTRLEAMPLGPEAAGLSFEARLARENGWTLAYAERVGREYRRFVFLCAHAGRPLTPSDAVDQAWHLHLCYSRSYWDRMCGEILESPLHHEPTRGGSDDQSKFADWYQATLTAYESVFGAPPPEDIWPPGHKRFENAASFRRVNLAENWVLPRMAVRTGFLYAAMAAIVLLGSAGCVRGEKLDRWEILMIVAVGVGVFGWFVAKLVRGGGGGHPGGGCGGCATAGGSGCASDGGSGCGSGCGGGCGGG